MQIVDLAFLGVHQNHPTMSATIINRWVLAMMVGGAVTIEPIFGASISLRLTRARDGF